MISVVPSVLPLSAIKIWSTLSGEVGEHSCDHIRLISNH